MTKKFSSLRHSGPFTDKSEVFDEVDRLHKKVETLSGEITRLENRVRMRDDEIDYLQERVFEMSDRGSLFRSISMGAKGDALLFDGGDIDCCELRVSVRLPHRRYMKAADINTDLDVAKKVTRELSEALVKDVCRQLMEQR